MVLTDVTDPVGPYYTDTKTNTIVFDRKTLAKSDKVQLIKDLAHEFGHYSKADDNPKSQDVAIFSENLIEKKIKGIESKEASESLLERVRNNENVLIGEVAKIRANRIPLEDREYVKWGRVFRGTAITFLGSFRIFLGISEIGLGVASSSVRVGVLVVGHGVAQTGFGLSETVEGLDHIRLGFIDISEEEREALSLSKKLLGKYEEALNFAVGGTTNQAVEIGQAFNRFSISNMTGNINSSTKKESNSNVAAEKQKSNSTVAEKVVEDTNAVNNKNTVTQTENNFKEVVSEKSIPKDKYGINQVTVQTTPKEVLKNTTISINKPQSEKVTLHEGKQGKHVVGHNNYIEGRSEVDMQTAGNILNDFQDTGTKFENNGKITKEVVDTHGKYVGIFVDEDTGQRSITSRFTIHYDSKGKAHVVPANPK